MWSVQVELKVDDQVFSYDCPTTDGSEDIMSLIAMGLLYEADWIPGSAEVAAWATNAETGDRIDLKIK